MPARIFENDPVNIERYRSLSFLGKVFVGVARRNGVDQIDNRLEAGVLGLFNAPGPIVWIVPGVGNAHFADPCSRHAGIVELMQRVGINRETTARAVDKSQRRFFELRHNQAVALPGIFTQFFNALRQLHRAAELDRFEAGFVE